MGEDPDVRRLGGVLRLPVATGIITLAAATTAATVLAPPSASAAAVTGGWLRISFTQGTANQLSQTGVGGGARAEGAVHAGSGTFPRTVLFPVRGGTLTTTGRGRGRIRLTGSVNFAVPNVVGRCDHILTASTAVLGERLGGVTFTTRSGTGVRRLEGLVLGWTANQRVRRRRGALHLRGLAGTLTFAGASFFNQLGNTSCAGGTGNRPFTGTDRFGNVSLVRIKTRR
jgi:hypothetical protein